MKIAIMQPYFYPYLGYLELMSKVDMFVIYSDVQFKKRSWICRNRLPDGLITIPTQCNKNTLIKDVDTIGNWKQNHLNRIMHLYKKSSWEHPILSPYFEKTKSLYEFLFNSISSLKCFFNLNCCILESHRIRPRTKEYQEDIIDICKLLNSKEYINLSGGVDLYQPKVFQQNEINLSFLKEPNYPNMFSILDLCLNEKITHLQF